MGSRAPSPGKGVSAASNGSRVETGIKDNRKSLPNPVPRAAAVLQGSWLRGFRVWGSRGELHLLLAER